MFDFVFNESVMESHHLVLHNKVIEFKLNRDRCDRVITFNCFPKFCGV